MWKKKESERRGDARTKTMGVAGGSTTCSAQCVEIRNKGLRGQWPPTKAKEHTEEKRPRLIWNAVWPGVMYCLYSV